MLTNMIQPSEPGFDAVLGVWWQNLNNRQWLTVDLVPGNRNPISDWCAQDEDELVWYYAMEDFTAEELEAMVDFAVLMRRIDSIQLTTALYITAQVDEDLLNELEIPGIWLVRVQRT
jgi:hypothetical protein